MRVLDLFCGGGGAAMGYHRAGFDVTGIDILPQPHYPFTFIEADALALLAEPPAWVGRLFDLIHASPPCKAYTRSRAGRLHHHQASIPQVREGLIALGLPYVIENVPHAPLNDPVMLCGCQFPELNVYRPRFFETNFPLPTRYHLWHEEPTTPRGQRPQPGARMSVVGNFSGVAEARKAMGIDWMGQRELAQAVPPVYTQWIADRFLDLVPAAKGASRGN